mgnify:CR=1 FL=1
MDIRIYEQSIDVDALKEIAREFYFPMLKGVIDIESGIVAFGGEYHMDANTLLMSTYSHMSQQSIWGFNIHLDKEKDVWLEYTSLINIRPTAGNMTMEIEDEQIRSKVKDWLDKKITQ